MYIVNGQTYIFSRGVHTADRHKDRETIDNKRRDRTDRHKEGGWTDFSRVDKQKYRKLSDINL